MLGQIRPALVMLGLMSLLTGLVYPLAVTGLARALFPDQAAGSLIRDNGTIVGSRLIGQNFTSDRYFQGRPSATVDTDSAGQTLAAPYNGAASLATNLGPTSQALIERIRAAVARLKAENDRAVPVDLVTTSASGLDPDITPAAALFQAPRIAKARGLEMAAVEALIAHHTQGRLFGLIGEVRVNVLALNHALDGKDAN
jgi:potassium-transporting ATPase KdpC subunit